MRPGRGRATSFSVLSAGWTDRCARRRHRFVYESALPVGRLVRQIADRSQVSTQRSWKRPYGVGLLVAGYDQKGPHLFNTEPSGHYWQYKATAIGARAQVRAAAAAAAEPPPFGLLAQRRCPRLLASRWPLLDAELTCG